VATPLKHAPRNCPVCGEILALTRLSCDECGTELAGHFPTCEYCSLSGEDREILRIFLQSRGNVKELERHLSVSYPTARARFDGILAKLGMDPMGTEVAPPPGEAPPAESTDILEKLSRGEIDVDEAMRRLS
jgi:hypothetical protein